MQLVEERGEGLLGLDVDAGRRFVDVSSDGWDASAFAMKRTLLLATGQTLDRTVIVLAMSIIGSPR